MSVRVPFIDLNVTWQSQKAEIMAAIEHVLDQGNFILGDQVKQLESQVARLSKTAEAVGLANGTDALTLLLKAMEIGPGDEVITSPFTFFATAESIMQVGAAPVFADIDPDTFNLDPQAVEQKINKNTKAIIPVHIFGQMADMHEFKRLADVYSLRLIEDACQAIGSAWDTEPPGSLSDGAAISFFPTKNLGTCGDGGIAVTQHQDIADRVRKLRVHGSYKKYYHDEIGWNSRLDEIHAAILNVKIKQLPTWNKQRRDAAVFYDQAFQHSSIKPPVVHPSAYHVYHLYTIISNRRDELKAFLQQHQIPSGVYYPEPLHLQKALRFLGYQAGDLPNAEKASAECLSLPLFPGITKEQQQKVADAVQLFDGGDRV